MKRAAIIVTDADSISWDSYRDGHVYGVTTPVDTSERLLADLLYLIEAAPGPEADHVRKALE